MRRRTLVGTVATLGPVALIGLFAALSILFSSPTPAYAESPQSGANEAPVFDEENPASRSVVENTATNTNIGAPVAATDPDAGDTLTYSLGGTDAASFAINASSGQLKTEAALDYETKASYSITVSVSDGDDTTADGVITVTVNVTNVNEDPTFGEGAAATRSVPENTATNTNIGDPITATDLDTGDTVTYSLVGTDAASFAIDASSGQLKTEAGLDYEAKPTYTVDVTARDASNLSDTITVTVNVTNVNEDPTFGERAAATRSVSENTATNTNIGAPVAATDLDAGDTLTYSLGGTDAASFAINESTGQLKTEAALDYEAKPTYTVEVTARDASSLSDTITVTVNVTNVNEDPTFGERAAATRSVSENTATNTNIGDPITAIDLDAGDTLTYSLGGTDAASFAINASSGQLKTKAALDYEARPTYEVAVQVSNGKNVQGTADLGVDDSIAVTITVADVNESPAFPVETSSRSVPENTATNTNIGTPVAATDPDTGDTLTYSLGGTDAASFAINGSTGQLKTKAALDYETKSAYEVTVFVRDSKDQDDRVNSVKDDTIDIDINVTNVEEPGRIVLSSRQPQVGTPLVAALTDPDGDITGTTWTWEYSLDKTHWALIASATLASYTPVDATGGNYLRVTASYNDGHGSGKTAQAVPDNPVRNAPPTNDPPAFAPENATRSVDENTAAGQDIGTPVAATDTANDRNMLTYSLEGTDAADFDINRATGQLLTKASLDHEAKERYNVTVKVVDPSATSDTIAVTINVNDVDEPPEVSGPDVVDYPENGTNVVAAYTPQTLREAR